MENTRSVSTAHACGWSAECPHCHEVEKVVDDCCNPIGMTIDCPCGHTYELDSIWDIDVR